MFQTSTPWLRANARKLVGFPIMHDLDKRILTFLFSGGRFLILSSFKLNEKAADLHPKQRRAFSHSLIEEAVGLPTANGT